MAFYLNAGNRDRVINVLKANQSYLLSCGEVIGEAFRSVCILKQSSPEPITLI